MLVLLLAGIAASADDDKLKAAAEARKDILELADGKGDPKAILGKHGLEATMYGFKLKGKGGIGVQGVQVAGKNGIEAQIIALAKQGPANLGKDAAALTKLAEHTKAIGEISANHKVKAAAGKTQKDWDKYNKDMIESSENLIKAIKGGAAKDVKTAASKLNQSCNECHAKFRDD